MGYVGPVLTKYLLKNIPDVQINGFDSGFFSHCLTTNNGLPEVQINKQYFGDLRNITEEMLKGIDCVVHLGAISNDPMGNKFESATREINYHASCRLANLANEMGVKNFVFASSCSIYGKSGEGAKKETDPLNPLTEYAKSKVLSEKAVKKNKRSLIIRTNFTGKKKTNTKNTSFIDWLNNQTKNKKNNINLFNDLYTSTIDAKNCAKFIIKLIEKNFSGIYNLGSRKSISKEKFALEFFKKMKVKLDYNSISCDILSVERCKYLGMSTKKIERDLGEKMPTPGQVINNLYMEYK